MALQVLALSIVVGGPLAFLALLRLQNAGLPPWGMCIASLGLGLVLAGIAKRLLKGGKDA